MHKQKEKKGKRTVHILPKAIIVSNFLSILNVVKLYHWKTKSYSEHKATDELYDRLNEHIDSFVEVMLGKTQTRVQFTNHSIPVMDFSTTEDFQLAMEDERDFLIDLTDILDATRDSDLLNIRDEILADVNQFLYLLSFTE